MGAAMTRVWANRALAVVALPLALLAVALASRSSPEQGARLARRAIGTLARACGVRFADAGLGAAAGERVVVVANHSSPLDIAAVLDGLPGARFLAAADLYRVPLLASAMRGVGTIPIERRHRGTARRQVDAIVETLDRLPAFRLVIFPEGGIPPAGERLPFKAGAFEIAIRVGAPILPVAIHGTADVLPPKGRLGVRPGVVCAEPLAPIPTEGCGPEDLDALRARAESAVLTALVARRPT
jgi:1-acyl-sn-glycerol-3-phosphate acyltransferase